MNNDLPCLCAEVERWMPIPSAPDYEASDHGRIRSLDRVIPYVDGRDRPIKGCVLRPATRQRGHLFVHIRGRTPNVHTLVLDAFRGPRPDGMETCHNDGDPTNNHLDNLRWDTRSSNKRDRVRHGTDHQTKKTHCPVGHPYDEVNTRIYVRSNGWVSRSCRICSLAHTHRRRAKARRLAAAQNGEPT